MRPKEELVRKLKRLSAGHGNTPEASIEAALAKEIALDTPVNVDNSTRRGTFAVIRGRRHPLD